MSNNSDFKYRISEKRNNLSPKFRRNTLNRKQKKREKKIDVGKVEVDTTLEFKFLQYLMDNKIPLEANLIEGITFTGNVKWFSEWLIGLKIEKEEVIFNRLMMIFYSLPRENSLSELKIRDLFWLKITENTLEEVRDRISAYEFKALDRLKDNFFSEENFVRTLEKSNFSKHKIDLIKRHLGKIYEPKFEKVELNLLNKFKEDNVLLTFYLNNNIQIKGYLEWAEKLIYHIRACDDDSMYNIYKDSIIYFHETPEEEDRVDRKDKKGSKKRKSKKKKKKKK